MTAAVALVAFAMGTTNWFGGPYGGGPGRVFVSADAMAFQPFRINGADNAALLENVMG